MAIRSFSDRKARLFVETGRIEKGTPWASLKGIVARKLDMLDYATILQDLRSPPGNHLEALSGDLMGHYSIRINQQWRIVFKWGDQGPREVRIVDYH